MAIIVEHNLTSKRYVFMGYGQGAYHVTGFLGTSIVNEREICVCDSKGEILVFKPHELFVVFVDNDDPNIAIKKSNKIEQETLFSTRKHFKVIELLEDKKLEYLSSEKEKRIKVSIDGKTPEDGFYRSKDLERGFEIKDGILQEVYKKKTLQQKTIDSFYYGGIFKGWAFVGLNPAPDGEYKDGFLSELIVVKDGKIVNYA